ncbi:MAG: low affinity iron permease family protein [bacterium]|nr:low affinity iron permease family protein [bacterium]
MKNNPAEFFRKFSNRVSKATGSFWAFILAALVIIVWLITGPFFSFSDTWQLVINTGTTIVTFLMVFLIQNSQNRESKSLHIKIDELIRATKNARNALIKTEDWSDNEIDIIEKEFIKFSKNETKKDNHKIHTIL